MDMTPGGRGRMVLALCVLASLAMAAAFTMEAGRFQQLVWVVLAFFALRVLLLSRRSR